MSRLSKDQLSAIASSLDADIEDLCGRLLGSSPVSYVWHDATYVKRRREGRVDGPQEGQPRVVYDGARLEAEARRMLRSVLELADRAETAWGITVFQVLGRRADSLRFRRYANFLNTTGHCECDFTYIDDIVEGVPRSRGGGHTARRLRLRGPQAARAYAAW